MKTSPHIITVLIMAALCWTSVALAQSRGRINPGQDTPWLPDLLEHPYPDYPYEARERKWQGSGLFRLTIDHNTGLVTKVEVTRSTGFPLLDQTSIQAFGKWHLKPGKWRQIYVPMTFTMGPYHT